MLRSIKSLHRNLYFQKVPLIQISRNFCAPYNSKSVFAVVCSSIRLSCLLEQCTHYIWCIKFPSPRGCSESVSWNSKLLQLHWDMSDSEQKQDEDEQSPQIPFCCDYDKRGQAKCKKCKEKFNKGKNYA